MIAYCTLPHFSWLHMATVLSTLHQVLAVWHPLGLLLNPKCATAYFHKAASPQAPQKWWPFVPPFVHSLPGSLSIFDDEGITTGGPAALDAPDCSDRGIWTEAHRLSKTYDISWHHAGQLSQSVYWFSWCQIKSVTLKSWKEMIQMYLTAQCYISYFPI